VRIGIGMLPSLLFLPMGFPCLADHRGPYEEARHLYTDLTGRRDDSMVVNGWSQAAAQKPPLTPALASF
jgi:hypothetical protein